MTGIMIVQRIGTVWSKKSRGGDWASRRNGCPEAASVPLLGQEDGVVYVHDLRFHESCGFAPSADKVTVHQEAKPLSVGCVEIEWAGEQVEARFVWERSCGAPERGWARKTLSLGLNEWGQIVYNGRFGDFDEGRWWYEKTVVNVGLFEHPSSGVFTRGAATCRFESLTSLW